MKKPKQSQPEGGVDIFKKKPIPKKPSQPEGSGVTKKKKLIQRQPEGSGVAKKKKLIQRQPEGSGAPKKITGRGEFADTNRAKKTKTDKKKTKTVKAPGGGPTTKPKAKISALASLDRKKNKKKERGPKVSVPGSMRDGPPQKVGTTKQKKVEPTKQKKVEPTKQKKVEPTKQKKLSFFEKIMRDTKKNFSGDFKKGTGRYKSISTGKTNFNKKKKKLPKQLRV